MAKEKLTTAEILALARSQDGGGASAKAPEPTAAEPDPPAGAPAAEAPASPAAAPAKPSSTADILAAARAQGGGDGAKPKAPAAAPKSTADILAAARAQGGGGGGPKAAPKSEAKKPQKKAAATVAEGDRPSVKDMVKALHEGVDPSAKPAPRLPGKPPLPKRTTEDVPRRAFPAVLIGSVVAALTTPFALAWTLMAVIFGLWGLLTARFMMPNMVVELPSKFKIGPPSDFPPGTVNEKFKASRGVWIVDSSAYNGEQIVYALASVCTHLGCTPNWLESEQKFKCPCHGSGFYISGINFEGPAPRPLERVGIRLAEDGMLEVDKSVKFQEELGQWQDPKSFISVG